MSQAFRLLTPILLAVAVPVFAQAPAAPFAQANRPDNLKGLCEQIQKAVAANDVNRAAALVKPLLPDEARIRKALREDAPADVVNNIVALHKAVTAGDAGRLFQPKPTQVVVQVHGATTEEIRTYARGTIVYDEFPSATQDLAKTVLRPGVTFYEVEFLEPGQQQGMKYHLFFWDGTRWTMLGPIWRAFRR